MQSGLAFAQVQPGNTVLGEYAGQSLNGASGNFNVTIGRSAGGQLTTGSFNTIVGGSAGEQLVGQVGNVAVGDGAGNKIVGDNNTFIGRWSGLNLTSGTRNVMLGLLAGANQVTGSYNTYIGPSSGPVTAQSGLQYATAIGAYAKATINNSLILGGTIDANNQPLSIKVGIGTSTPISKLHVTGGGMTLGTNVNAPATEDGYLSLGDINTSSTPTNPDWSTKTTLLINAQDYSTIGFHDSGNRVDFIRVGSGMIDLGYDGGFGAAHIGLPKGIWGSGGNVGIGTTSPIDYAQLHVHGPGGIVSTGPGSQIRIRDQQSARTTEPWLDEWSWYATGNVSRFHRPGLGDVMAFSSLGNVGIGTINPGNFKLAVEGIIGAREVEVKTGAWADFVFDDAYSLPSLQSVREHIATKKHLPGIPSEAEVKRDGYALGAMDAKLLQKIEELTLYILEQQKRIERLERELVPLKKP